MSRCPRLQQALQCGAVPLLLLTALGCKSYFNEEIRAAVQNERLQDVEHVQFYNDRRIEIVHKTTSVRDDIDSGKVEFKAGYYYYYVVFPKYTKGRASHVDENTLAVNFEEGDSRVLLFRRNGRDRYQLQGYPGGPGQLFVEFESSVFEVVDGKEALLMIKKNYQEKTNKDRRRVKGVKVE